RVWDGFVTFPLRFIPLTDFSLVVPMRTLALIILACTLAPPSVWSQQVRPGGVEQHFEVDSVGASVGVSSQSVPEGVQTFDDVYLGSSGSMSASVLMGWPRAAPTSFRSVSSSTLYGNRLETSLSK